MLMQALQAPTDQLLWLEEEPFGGGYAKYPSDRPGTGSCVLSCKAPSLPETLPSKHFLRGMEESLGTHHFHKAVKNLG